MFDPRWSARVAALLAADPQMVGTKVHVALTDEGFQGSYATVIRHLRAVRGPQPRAIMATIDRSSQELQGPSPT